MLVLTAEIAGRVVGIADGDALTVFNAARRQIRVSPGRDRAWPPRETLQIRSPFWPETLIDAERAWRMQVHSASRLPCDQRNYALDCLAHRHIFGTDPSAKRRARPTNSLGT